MKSKLKEYVWINPCMQSNWIPVNGDLHESKLNFIPRLNNYVEVFITYYPIHLVLFRLDTFVIESMSFVICFLPGEEKVKCGGDVNAPLTSTRKAVSSFCFLLVKCERSFFRKISTSRAFIKFVLSLAVLTRHGFFDRKQRHGYWERPMKLFL